MTEPSLPEPTGPPPEEPTHGLVEEIRHEIEEVVEHVPKPVRWTVKRLVALGIAALVALVVLAVISIVLYYANRTELAARELTLYLNHTLSTRSDVQIDVSDIRGNPFQRLRLVNPKVVFRDGGAPILEAPWIELGYSPLALLRHDGRSLDVVIESPVIRLGRRADGSLRFPEWKTSGGTGKAGAVDVSFRMHQGTVVLPDPGQRIEGLDIDALLATGEQSRASIRSLKWRSGPYETRRLELAGEIAAGDSVRFRIGRLATEDFALRAAGGWKKGERTKVVHLDLDHLSWRWLSRVTKNGAFDVPGDARATLDARGDSSWTGSFATSLEWNGLPMVGSGGFGYRGGRLRLEPLQARSKAGDLRGSAGWAREGWDVGGDVTNGDPEAWDAIGIPGWPKGALNGRFRYAVDTRSKPSNGSVVATLGPSELAGWRVDSSGVTVSLPGRGTRTFDVNAVRRGGRFTLHGATDDTGWDGTYQVLGLPLDEWPDGRASGIRGMLDTGAGTVRDVHGTMSVTGELKGRATDWFGMHAAAWRLASVNGVLLPKPDLTAATTLGDVMFLGIHFDSVASPVHLGDRNLDLVTTTAQAGDTLIALAGHAAWNDGGAWSLDLTRAAASSGQFHWTADPPLQLAGDKQGVVFRRMEAHDGVATLNVDGRWAVPGGTYDWRLDGKNLDLGRLGLPVAWGLGGAATVALRVEGASGDPRWTLDGSASGPKFGGHRGDSLELALTGAPSKVGVERATFVIGGGSLEARGRIDRTAKAWPDSLTGTAVSRWLTGAAAWSGTITAKGFPIERVTGLFAASAGWAGRLDGSVRIDGSPAQPELGIEAAVAPLTWRDFNLERLSTESRYAGERLTVTRLTASRSGLESSAEGEIPVRIAFDRPWQLLDRPMDATLRVRQGDLRLLPRLLPQFAAAAGTLEADATIRGTPLAPNLDGRGHVTGGSFRLAGRSEVLEQVQAWFRLNASTLSVDSLTAREGEDGRVRASGTVKLERLVPSAYQLNVALSDFTASEPGLYAAQFDGNFIVTDGPRVHGQWLPYVTGRATINRAVVLIDFANQTEGAQLAASNPPLYWLYRIDLTAKSNIHWQPPDGDIELSADLTAEQTPTELRVYGEMQAIRGTYYFLSNRFTIDHATLTFDNVSGLNPQLDAQATTRVVPLAAPTPSSATASAGSLSSSDKANQPHQVTVTITGRSREPVIAFESDPSDWDQDVILQQLTVGRFYSTKDRLASTDPFDNYITRAINRTVSAELSRAFRGYLNDWVFEREQGGLFVGQGQLIVGARAQVTRNLVLGYKQVLPGLARDVTTPTSITSTPFERDFEAEYRLNRFFLVSSQLTQRRALTGTGTNISATPDFNVDLKARWEY